MLKYSIKKINNYLIEIGGEIRSKGKNPSNKLWTIGVDKPNEEIDSKDRFEFILKLEDKSLATSGNYRKFYIENGINILISSILKQVSRQKIDC